MARLGSLLALGLALSTASASAQPTPSDRALATELFKEGRALMDQKRHAEACPKLEESQRLDPGGGTLLNLALCHEALGRTATAWTELNEALGVARRDRRTDREKLAAERMRALEPRLSRLTLVVTPATAVPGLALKRDGTEVGQAAWGTAMPVDPGRHDIEAAAPGYASWSSTVEVAAAGDRRTVEIPALVPLPPPAIVPPPPEPAASDPTVVPLPPGPPPAPAPAPPPADRPSAPSLVPAYVVVAAGMAGIAVGSVFGVRAISKRSDSDDACAPKCGDRAVELNEQAKTAADVSTVLFIVGAAGLGAGAYLWIDAVTARPKAQALLIRGRF